MSSIFLAPQRAIRTPVPTRRRALFDWLPHTAGKKIFKGGIRTFAQNAVQLRGFDTMAASTDRSFGDFLMAGVLILLLHAIVADRLQHPQEPVKPKEKTVEIEFVRPPPPPPPPPPPEVKPQPVPPKPVVQPKPVPPKPVAQPKPAAPPKPKPVAQPKPKPSPVATQPAPPVLEDVPFADNAAPVDPAAGSPTDGEGEGEEGEQIVEVSDADYLRAPEPEYPEEAQERGLEGRAMVRVRILASGEPDEVQIETSSGHPSLDAAAIQAVKGAQFRPGIVDKAATAVWALIPISFQL